MLHSRIVFFSLCFVCLIKNIFVLDNGLARTPPMGWMSWGYYMCGTNCEKSPEKCLDEKLILSVADYFYEEGFQELGYEYIIIDDCWSERTRDSKGRLVPDVKRFPHGMKFLSDYIHSRGLKFGMYTNVANVTCMGYPGSRAHFRTDADTFAAWGVDYLKVDGCFVSKEFLDVAYINFGEALNNSGRPMVYSCSWPYYVQYIHKQKPDYKRIQPHCNLWRNFHDIATSWKAVRYVIQHYENEYDNIAAYHGPGHWNDPDMLIIGTETLTDSQSRIQLAVFSMMSAPLLLSCDITKVTEYEKRLLQNVELIAIAQDPLGEMAKPYKIKRTVTLWVKRHLPMKGDKYHSFSFALVNWDENRSQSVSFKPALYADMNSQDGYSVMDVFSLIYQSNVTLKDSLLITVPPEDVIIYTLYPL